LRVEWLPVAEQNREDQLIHIADRNPLAAIDMGDTIEAAVLRLADNPRLGRPGRIPGTRELVVGGTPFIAAHRVEENTVVILRLLHGAERWPSAL
jgi:toxin ParE1/3/4